MTPEAIKKAVAEGIASYYADPEQCSADHPMRCRYDIAPEAHRKQHEAMEKFMGFVGKVDDLKWSVLKKVVVYLILAAFGLMAYGALVKIKLFKLMGG